jgi:hypothetical protein
MNYSFLSLLVTTPKEMTLGADPTFCHASQTVEVSQNLKYRLPRRELNVASLPAGISLVCGVFVGGVSLTSISLFHAGIFRGLHGGVWERPGLLVYGSALIAGLFAVRWIVYGLTGLFGHVEIEFRGQRLHVVERCGCLTWSRSVRLDRIRRFRALYYGERVHRQPAGRGFFVRFGSLAVQIGPRRWKTLVHGYPAHWLQALADRLSKRLGLTTTGATPEQQAE